MSTQNYRTKTLFMERKNPSIENIWNIALDIGYSAVKGFSPNMIYSFPSYAVRISEDSQKISDTKESDILYKNNKTGEMWHVGACAQDMTSTSDSTDSEAFLYGRNRYYSDVFQVIASVGLAIGMMENKYGNPQGKNLVLQTGLPPAYLKKDSSLLKNALSGEKDFSVKIGNQPWRKFHFTLPEENIGIMSQPKGTLFSIAKDSDGKTNVNAKKYFNSNLLIFDPGFGTLDTFSIKNGYVDSYETCDNLGMKRVLKETSDEIFKQFDVEIPVPAMQKSLETGKVRCFKISTMETKDEDFDFILKEQSQKICMEAIEKIKTIYNNLVEYDYLVLAGGTSAAWNTYIREYFSKMTTLTIIAGNQNDTLPYIFSNVRGYYLYQFEKLQRNQK